MSLLARETVKNCDSLKEIKKMSDNSVDLVITDPPYGMEFQSNYRKEKHKKIEGDESFNVEMIKEMIRVARKAVYVFCRWDNIYELPKPKSFIVWAKNNWSMGDLEHEHARQWEGIAFYPCEEHEFFKRPTDLIYAKRTNNDLHPTQKPVSLIRDILKHYDKGVVFDPYCGSGSTLLAAKNLGWGYIGYEIEKQYYDVCVKRLSQSNLLEVLS